MVLYCISYTAYSLYKIQKMMSKLRIEVTNFRGGKLGSLNNSTIANYKMSL